MYLFEHRYKNNDLGIKRINVSLDSLIPQKYSFITNGGSLTKVLNGIFQAKDSGIKIKINVVLLKKCFGYFKKL